MRWHALPPLIEIQDGEVTPNSAPIRYNKDPWSWITHAIGMIAATAGTLYLLAISPDIVAKKTGMAIYGGSLTLCMATSTAYHFFDLGVAGNRWLRRADHSAIFLLIGGTFVPACLHLLTGTWRTGSLTAIAVMAAAGILFKLAWLDAPRWLGTGVYIAMGWAVCIPGTQMFPLMADSTLFWLLAGGGFFTGGAIIYGIKKPDPLPGTFGFHEIWHIFVLAGAACHFTFAHSFCALPYFP